MGSGGGPVAGDSSLGALSRSGASARRSAAFLLGRGPEVACREVFQVIAGLSGGRIPDSVPDRRVAGVPLVR